MRECAVEREASRGIATSRDWGRAINVGEAAAGGATGTGCRKRSRWDNLLLVCGIF